MLILDVFLMDVFSHARHICSQLLLGNETIILGKLLARGYKGCVQSRGEDDSLRRQAGCPSHGQHTGVQNETRLFVDEHVEGGRRGSVDFGLSSRQENYSGPKNKGGKTPMHGWSNIGGWGNKIR